MSGYHQILCDNEGLNWMRWGIVLRSPIAPDESRERLDVGSRRRVQATARSAEPEMAMRRPWDDEPRRWRCEGACTSRRRGSERAPNVGRRRGDVAVEVPERIEGSGLSATAQSPQ